MWLPTPLPLRLPKSLVTHQLQASLCNSQKLAMPQTSELQCFRVLSSQLISSTLQTQTLVSLSKLSTHKVTLQRHLQLLRQLLVMPQSLVLLAQDSLVSQRLHFRCTTRQASQQSPDQQQTQNFRMQDSRCSTASLQTTQFKVQQLLSTSQRH